MRDGAVGRSRTEPSRDDALVEVAAAGVRDVRAHTAATILTGLGAGARTVQEILGHSRISQAERYVHVSSDHAREAVKKMSSALLDDQ